MRIAVGGMIGVGKTSLCKKLQPYMDTIHTVFADFRKDDIIWNTLLDNKYAGDDSQNLALQIYILTKVINEIENNFHCITDRSILEHYIFAEFSLSKDDFLVYDLFFKQQLNKNKYILPEHHIILDKDVDDLIEQVKERNRNIDITLLNRAIESFTELDFIYTTKLRTLCQLYSVTFTYIEDYDYDDIGIFNYIREGIEYH